MLLTLLPTLSLTQSPSLPGRNLWTVSSTFLSTMVPAPLPSSVILLETISLMGSRFACIRSSTFWSSQPALTPVEASLAAFSTCLRTVSIKEVSSTSCLRISSRTSSMVSAPSLVLSSLAYFSSFMISSMARSSASSTRESVRSSIASLLLSDAAACASFSTRLLIMGSASVPSSLLSAPRACENSSS